MKYILLLIFIIFMLIYVFKKNKSIESFNNKEKSIAVVGNGPLTSEDRELINTFDIVYRFNDCKNKKENDKINCLIVRQTSYTKNVTGLNSDYKIPLNVDELIFIGCSKQIYEKIKKANKNTKIIFIEVYEKDLCKTINCNRTANDVILFNNHKIKESTAPWGASSGFLALAYLSNIYKNIHIFGMNWNFNFYMKHDSLWEKNNIKKYCENCVIHPTKKNSY